MASTRKKVEVNTITGSRLSDLLFFNLEPMKIVHEDLILSKWPKEREAGERSFLTPSLALFAVMDLAFL